MLPKLDTREKLLCPYHLQDEGDSYVLLLAIDITAQSVSSREAIAL